MSTTTDILFNSPALHSLKRAQLVQLCKRHNIKANGKNGELVEKLKQHAVALKLEHDTNTNVQMDNDDGDDANDDDEDSNPTADRPQRPSEMWEIVMDAIPEEEAGSSKQGSLSSKSTLTVNANAEFGTAGSSKSTVSSSIKAFASSFGLKRNVTVSESGTLTSSNSRKAIALSSQQQKSSAPRDSLLSNAIPYGSIPTSSSLPLHTEPYAFSYAAHDTSLTMHAPDGDTSMASLDRPIPGTGSRSGVEVAGLGAMTGAGTIRLISSTSEKERERNTVVGSDSPPKLTPFQPTFDLVPPTPGGMSAMKWPKTPGGASVLSRAAGRTDEDEEWKGIYPTLSNEAEMDESMDIPGGLGSSSTPTKKMAMLSPPGNNSNMFIFGSPNANKTKSDFTQAASSVLAEMNARLGLSGTQPLGSNILAGASKAKMNEDEILNYQFGGAAGKFTSSNDNSKDEGSVRSKFDRAHERLFAKMEGIDKHYAARREKLEPLPQNRKRKSNALGEQTNPRRPSAVNAARRSSTARVISAGTRKKLGMALPGAFGEDDDDNDEEREEAVERQAKRARPSVVPSGQKRVSIAPKASDKGDKSDDEDANEVKSRKEREAIKRKLEIQKARRRSSKGRPSMGGPRASLANQKKAQAKGATSRFGFLSSAKSLVKSVWNRGAGAPTPAPAATASKPVVAAAKATSSANGSVSKTASNTGTVTSNSSKPPIPSAKKPSFNGLGAATNNRPSTSSRLSVATRTASASSNGLLQANTTKSGTVTSNVSIASTSTAGRRSRSPLPAFEGHDESGKGNTSSRMSGVGGGSRASRKSMVPPPQAKKTRPSSTLLAPTASSLAKMNANPVRRPLPIPPAASGSTVTSPTAALSPSKIPVILPLSPRKKSTTPLSPTVTGGRKSIFSTPLVLNSKEGSNINPITGEASPSRIPLAASGIPNQGSLRRGLSVQRKPRISRSKIIAKLAAQRAASASSKEGLVASSSTGLEHQSAAIGSGSRKVRPRSSIGAGRTRSSMGAGRHGMKAAAGLSSARGSSVGVGAGGVLMAAKRRARASEYARRRSARPAVTMGGDEGMDVDD